MRLLEKDVTFLLARWKDNEGEHDIFIRPSLLAYLSCAEANLGRHSTEAKNARRAVNVALDIRERKADISAMTAEQS